MLMNGVFRRLIKTSLPKPDPFPFASALIYVPFSFDPNNQLVCPFTFFTLRLLNSSSVKSKAFIISAADI